MENLIQQANYKLTDIEFWSALRENGGLFARTARHIQNKYKIGYSRQAVLKRATATLEAKVELEDIIEETLDIAEEGLFTLIRSGQPSTRLAAIKLFLNAKGKCRGYGKGGVEINAKTGSNEPTENTQEPIGMGPINFTVTIKGND